MLNEDKFNSMSNQNMELEIAKINLVSANEGLQKKCQQGIVEINTMMNSSALLLDNFTRELTAFIYKNELRSM